MWSPLFLVVVYSAHGTAAYTNSCVYMPCRWNLVREAEDSSKVIVQDSSVHNINWKWDVRGGHWNVTYSYKYPSEVYSGKAIFVNSSVTSSGENAFVSWGSNIPWMSNAIPIHNAKPWNISYNGDTFGFLPAQNGRYSFRIFSKNKRHNPFRSSEPIGQPPGQCSLSSNDRTRVSQWWQEQKSSKVCSALTLLWNWQGKNGKWTVHYRYVESIKKTVCDVYYQGNNGLPQMKVINWELDEMKQSVSYVTNPIRIYETGWQVALSPTETWGFTPTGDGLWIFQHFSRNLVFQPFQNLRGTILVGGTGKNAPMYAVGTPAQNLPYSIAVPGQSSPMYSGMPTMYNPVGIPVTNGVGAPIQSFPIYENGTPIRQDVSVLYLR